MEDNKLNNEEIENNLQEEDIYVPVDKKKVLKQLSVIATSAAGMFFIGKKAVSIIKSKSDKKDKINKLSLATFGISSIMYVAKKLLKIIK